MTYAAGLDAFSIIWIAKSFTEEHRAALDWLNRITEENIKSIQIFDGGKTLKDFENYFDKFLSTK